MQAISLYDIISLALSGLAIIMVVLSLFYQRKQTGEMTRALKSSTFLDVAAQMITTDQIFIEHPEMRPYFYAGQEISEGAPEYHRAAAIAELLLDFFGTVLLQSSQFPQAWSKDWWSNYIRDMLANSPILRHYLNHARAWYNQELVALLDEVRVAESKPILRQLSNK